MPIPAAMKDHYKLRTKAGQAGRTFEVKSKEELGDEAPIAGSGGAKRKPGMLAKTQGTPKKPARPEQKLPGSTLLTARNTRPKRKAVHDRVHELAKLTKRLKAKK